jgi:ankyrin repeat protein
LLDRRKELLESLQFENIDSRYLTIKSAQAKTCRWLLQHSDFLAWRNPSELDQHHGFLWISGKPGAGKSTLMKFAYNHAINNAVEDETIVCFFFNARGDDLEKSVMGMYRSLLFQLFTKLPDLQEVLDDSNLTLRSISSDRTLGIELLHGLLSAAILKLGRRCLAFYIDALDECNEQEVRTMKENFERLGENAVESGIQLYICFSSRHYPYIDVRYGRKLVLEDQIGHQKDLDSFVRSKLRLGTRKQLEPIMDEILERATGIFMWVVLVVDILNKEFEKGRMFAVRKRLREIPDELHQLFRDILTRDNNNMDDLLLCIQWILYSNRPLKSTEFYFALTSGLDPKPENLEWKKEDITLDDMDRFVLSSSKGLAEVTKSKARTVQFIHESVRDFLIKDNGIHDLWPELKEDFRNVSLDRLKQCCHTYLTTIEVSKSVLHEAISDKIRRRASAEMLSEKFPFLEYATHNMLQHAEAAAFGSQQDEFLQKIEKSGDIDTWVLFVDLFQKFEARIHSLNTASFLYILADNNWARLITACRRRHPSIEIEGGRYRYPLFAAMVKGHREAARALLDQDTSFSREDDSFSKENDLSSKLEYGSSFTWSKTQTPLLWAITKGHKSLAEHLLRTENCDIEQKNAYGQTPLILAVANEYADLVQLLLEQGANVEAEATSKGTALSVAVRHGNEAIVRLLLDQYARIETRVKSNKIPFLCALDADHANIIRLLLERGAGLNAIIFSHTHHSALSWSAANGYEDIVQLLLDKGADIEAKVLGRTSLSWAVGKGHLNVVKLLADKGADTEAEYQGRTSLSWAAGEGHLDIVKLLLNKGAEVEAANEPGWTPLSWAAGEGHLDIVKLLLDKGADIEAKVQGRTSLSWAAGEGHLDIVKLLLDKGAEIEAANEPGWTPLSWAAGEGHLDIVKLLLDKGAEIEAENEDGWTPLLNATVGGQLDVVKLLIDKGAKLGAEDRHYYHGLLKEGA